MSNVTIDTNLLIDDEDILLKLSTKYNKIIIPLTVLKELDKLKHRSDTSYSARRAIHAIRKFSQLNPENIEFYHNESLSDDNDAKIIRAAQATSSVLATKDLSMSILANAHKVPTEAYDVSLNNTFTPYVYIQADKLYKCAQTDVFCYDKLYSNGKYKEFVSILNLCNKKHIDEAWYFIFINNIDSIYIYAHNPIKCLFERIDNNPKYLEIKIPNQAQCLKALDEYQTCCIYAMIEAPNVLITGSYGSGKTLLSTAYSLENQVSNKKTFISRPSLTVDSRFKLGYLPGTESEKLTPWLGGVLSSLYFLFSNTRGQRSDGSKQAYSYDHVKENIFESYFEPMSIETIQGISFMMDDLLLLDEVQLCSTPILSTILSRFGKGSKLIATGDPNQCYDVIRDAENGLLKLINLMPNKNIAYVQLKNNYRAGLVEIADSLNNKSIG